MPSKYLRIEISTNCIEFVCGLITLAKSENSLIPAVGYNGDGVLISFIERSCILDNVYCIVRIEAKHFINVLN